jgi:hypothetical protein
MRLVIALSVLPFAIASGEPPRITGAYHSNWEDVQLVQRGKQVSGTYVCCGGGTIHGTIDGNVIRYRWRQPGGDGHGVWVIEGDHLSGTWGVGAGDSDGGRWDLVLASQIAD